MPDENVIPLNEEFLRLFVAHQRRIYRYLATLILDAHDIEEVLQRTSMALWRKFSEFRGDADFGRWACGFAHLQAQCFLREQSRDRHRFDCDLVDQLAADAVTQDEVMESRRRALVECLQRLSSADRDLIGHCYSEQSSFKEVARRLNRPLNTVYKALSRIRRVLAECVGRRMAVEGRQ